MAAGNLGTISLDDADVDYDDYVGVLEGGVLNRSERMLDAYTDLESQFRDQFEEEVTEDPDRHLDSSDGVEAFRTELADVYEERLYPTLSSAGEEDIGGYAEFQDTMRTLSELNYVRFYEQLEDGRSAVSKTRNHSSNALTLLNEVGEILTEKGYTHETKEPIKERFSESKRQLKAANRRRHAASATVKRCYFYYFTGELLREKYGLEPAEYRYVDFDEPIRERLDRVREEFVRQAKQISHGRRSLQHKIEYIKKNYDL
ncbi:hypothetical protein ACFR9U_00970 [Halorientalis brevis]|uniref:Uncharacterized protein n=1 Tax=Halorientalis brevis TaxID=1126241 RepID=A0ABD6C5I6_9EURY|nr:hypothetical protein [Halorientalis brevis]